MLLNGTSAAWLDLSVLSILPFLLTAAKSPSAQLMEQVAQLKSLSDTIEKLKVSHILPFPYCTALGYPWESQKLGKGSLDQFHALWHAGEQVEGRENSCFKN